jgi:hypothetical protein
MTLDLTDDETRALLIVLMEAIEDARYSLSPRIHTLRAILMKIAEMEGVAPDLAAKPRRYAPHEPLTPRKYYEPPSRAGIAVADEALPRPAHDTRERRRGQASARRVVQSMWSPK